MLSASAFLEGCGITPKVEQRDTVAYDGNDHNAGIVGLLDDGSLEITQSALDRYNALIEDYGDYVQPVPPKSFGVEKLENGNFALTKQGAETWDDLVLIKDREQIERSDSVWQKFKPHP